MKNLPKIKVIGVGGSGSNTVSRMLKCKIKGVDFIAVNTDAQDLRKVRANVKIRIGRKLTQGLGAGMNPEIGEKAAEEQKEEIKNALENSDLVFITYGAGGGTGTGAGPVIAEIARNLGILTIAIVTKPFSFEGISRRKVAEAGIQKLKSKVDSLIVIPNDKLLRNLDPKITLLSAFWLGDEILREAVLGITDLIISPGIINVDFASIKSILENSGKAIFGIGSAQGEKRAEKAVLSALKSPLIDSSPQGAKGVLFNVSGSDISLAEVEEVAKIITKEVSPDAKIIFGAVEDEKLKKGEVKVIVIITGFNEPC
ncbi:MAG: cell division protein FtsZ [Candidatus Nealsonbacteria bacterium CG08_land_8_20_14_0_20_38_20]|uniref:Cell division protein FtsZ n=1 Tax=Candidatus Nealsonbacteria bacterium CG08_land_8_20_14_0_20_38_20 TaxID=1974705 RepID=A0A2H0YM16_9BACT|nr:MAG: cell division protein FtsZ [Candidatus Nealsonbacteria bacterium CG08_land_8_20_14_0_20_38_20]